MPHMAHTILEGSWVWPGQSVLNSGNLRAASTALIATPSPFAYVTQPRLACRGGPAAYDAGPHGKANVFGSARFRGRREVATL